jgi:hypothetical protein
MIRRAPALPSVAEMRKAARLAREEGVRVRFGQDEAGATWCEFAPHMAPANDTGTTGSEVSLGYD